MNEELDFLEQDNTNPADATIEPAVEVAEQEQFEAPSWDDVKSGKIKYQDLPPNIKTKVKQEAYEQTPDDKKYLWDEYNFTPPETYHGVDRNGKKVNALGLEGFEELVNAGRIKPKTKIEEDVEKLTKVVTNNTKMMLSQREKEVDSKIAQLRENGLVTNEDFAIYEEFLAEKQNVKFEKLQLESKPEQVSFPTKQQESVAQDFTLEEQTAVEVFRNNPDNKVFIDLMQNSREMQKSFDESAFLLRQRNPSASLDAIAIAAKTIVESKFNLNKQPKQNMTRNIIQSEQKTAITSKPASKLSYNSLSDRDKKWINSEARSGRAKYSGKSLDDITNMVYGSLLKK